MDGPRSKMLWNTNCTAHNMTPFYNCYFDYRTFKLRTRRMTKESKSPVNDWIRPDVKQIFQFSSWFSMSGLRRDVFNPSDRRRTRTNSRHVWLVSQAEGRAVPLNTEEVSTITAADTFLCLPVILKRFPLISDYLSWSNKIISKSHTYWEKNQFSLMNSRTSSLPNSDLLFVIARRFHT